MSAILNMPSALRALGLSAIFGAFAVLATGPLANNAAAQQGEPTCDDGAAYATEGSLLDRDAVADDATSVSALRFGAHESCERLVIDFANADGTDATMLGNANVAFHREEGIIRVHLPADFPRTTLPDGATDVEPAGEYIQAAYTVMSDDANYGPFVDVHVDGAVAGRAFVLDSPARLVVDVRPGGNPVGDAAHGGANDNVVVVSPEPGSVSYPININGYSRTFEANVIARLYQDGEMVAETSTMAAAWAETWGEFNATIDSGPSGELELFVGTESAQDGSEQGVRFDVTVGETDPGNGTPPPGTTTYVVAPGDSLSAIAAEFGVSVEALASRNEIANPNLIVVGQELIIPGTGGQGPNPELMAAVDQYVQGTLGETYAGDCAMTDIEEDVGSFCSAIVSTSANLAVVDIGPAFSEFTSRLTYAMADGEWVLSATDELPLPGNGDGETYTVQAGDTLWAIAAEHGTTVDAIVDASDISDANLIVVGQELTIPAS